MQNRNFEDLSETETVDSRMIYAALLLLVAVGALITYKTTASLAVLEKVQSTGVFKARFELIQSAYPSIWVDALNKTFSYFSAVWIALLFGVLISGAVRVFVSPRWLSRLVGGGGRVRSQLTAAAAGAPLMLCSCCVAPVFTSVYEKSSRLAPSLALMLAAPSLNPAALILTFMLFGAKLGALRLLFSALAVLLPGLLAEKFIKFDQPVCPVDEVVQPTENKSSIFTAFLASCFKVAVQTLPLILIGVAVSMLITQWLPTTDLGSPAAVAVILVASVSVLLAMPTFFEIPLALAMVAAGLPEGAALAILVAGPATNLPSLFTIARSTGWKVPLLVGATVWALAVVGGLSAGLF